MVEASGDDMRPTRRRLLRLTTVLCTVAVPVSAARAQGQSWPSKPIRIITPGAAGAVTDIRARWLADKLGPVFGQPIVVENRPGAGGNLGTVAGARSAPDGYTLLIIHIGTMAINPHIYPNPGYDPLVDLAPITRLGVGPLALVVHKSVPAGSVKELVELARAKPGELTFSSPGIGTPGHLASGLLMHFSGIRATHVPYKSSAQATTDLAAGHVTWTIEGNTLLKPFIQDGRLRALAVTTAQRNKSMPDVPTMAEAGIAGYELTAWAGLAAPAGTPKPIIDRIYGEIAKVLATRETQDWFESFGAAPGGETPEVFAELVRVEYARLGEVVRAVGIKAE
jgi:tripartite-type tricarboxylate transporter receptor subunit TctC